MRVLKKIKARLTIIILKKVLRELSKELNKVIFSTTTFEKMVIFWKKTERNLEESYHTQCIKQTTTKNDGAHVNSLEKSIDFF